MYILFFLNENTVYIKNTWYIYRVCIITVPEKGPMDMSIFNKNYTFHLEISHNFFGELCFFFHI